MSFPFLISGDYIFRKVGRKINTRLISGRGKMTSDLTMAFKFKTSLKHVDREYLLGKDSIQRRHEHKLITEENKMI